MVDTEEVALEPERPIIDSHLHLWDIGAGQSVIAEPQTFLLAHALATLGTAGHHVTHSVFVECGAMYRTGGPPELRSLGETEFANGAAAMCESGRYGPALLAHRIVGNVDLVSGAAARGLLEAHIAVCGKRFAGVRNVTAFRETGLFGAGCDPARRAVLADPQFREGAAVLAEMGLVLDVWCLDRQLGELADFADALPDLAIVLDHVGTPDCADDTGAFGPWRARIADLARRPNVRVKLGGLGMDLSRTIDAATGCATGAQLADAWRPWIETCIEAFGPRRTMFESNFPPDKSAGSYGATWNAFKIIAAGCPDEDKDWLFRRTAADTYRIALPA